MSEIWKRFVDRVRGLFSDPEEDPLRKMPDMEPDEEEDQDAYYYSNVARYEAEREVEH